MSIVENVWHILKVTINEQDPHLVMEEELWIAIQEEWNKLGDKTKRGFAQVCQVEFRQLLWMEHIENGHFW